jgi:hypothetical protein
MKKPYCSIVMKLTRWPPLDDESLPPLMSGAWTVGTFLMFFWFGLIFLPWFKAHSLPMTFMHDVCVFGLGFPLISRLIFFIDHHHHQWRFYSVKTHQWGFGLLGFFSFNLQEETECSQFTRESRNLDHWLRKQIVGFFQFQLTIYKRK